MDVQRMMSELRTQVGSEGLERVEECLEILVGQRVPTYLHDDQEPTRLFFPGISAQPWHDPSAQSWVGDLENSFEAIKAEFLALRSDDVKFAPYEDFYTKELGWKGWNNYQVYRDGTWSEDARRRCPVTCAALSRTPHGPRDGMFTVLNPDVHITAHTGGVNLLLTAHLPLVVPEGCVIRVADDERGWEEGKLILFDDSFIHEAWNRGSQQRAVLLWDIWHPDLTSIEVQALEYLMPRFQRHLMAV